MRGARKRSEQTLGALADVARRVGEGDLGHRVPPVAGDDALRDAVAAFNAMVDRLARSRRQLVHKALHDPLTGLPNRSLFADRVAHALARTRAGRARGGALAVLFVDLDGFKAVNDLHGHDAGDALLVAVTARLAGGLRPHDTVARLGGDEFAVLLDDLDALGDAARVAERLIAAVADPVVVDGRDLRVGASVGIAVAVPGEAPADELMRRADAAMYAAKAAGKGCHRAFEGGLAAADRERAGLEAELHAALAAGALTLAYEPVVDLATRRSVGVHARLRWQRAGGAETLDDERLRALADDCGLAVPLARWALGEACRQVADLQRLAGAGRERLALWLTLPARELLDANVVADVAVALRTGGLRAGDLVLGVPEDLLTAERAPVAEALAELAGLGVRLSVESFGTGAAGLTHLRAAPFAALGLHPRLLVAGAEGTLVRAAVALAHALGLAVVADGVERAEQAEGLRALGVALARGPLVGRALPHAALAAQLAAEAGPVRAPTS